VNPKTLFHRPSIDLAGLEALAAALAARAAPGDVILLKGDLGSGKTTFARAFIRSLGIEEDVPSPTFTLLQTYEAMRGEEPLSLYHFDLYRLEDEEDLRELGLEDALDAGISLIEWPEVAAAALPGERLEIGLATGPSPNLRAVTITGGPGWEDRLSRSGL
jgi:tRNA threonylcarbamoyladenosine biosynthesis protein TsaE